MDAVTRILSCAYINCWYETFAQQLRTIFIHSFVLQSSIRTQNDYIKKNCLQCNCCWFYSTRLRSISPNEVHSGCLILSSPSHFIELVNWFLSLFLEVLFMINAFNSMIIWHIRSFIDFRLFWNQPRFKNFFSSFTNILLVSITQWITIEKKTVGTAHPNKSLGY